MQDFAIQFSRMGNPGSENVRLSFYFADLIFVVCQSTTKTVKIGSLENFRLYGIWCVTFLGAPSNLV